MIYSRTNPLTRLLADRNKDIFANAGIPHSTLCAIIDVTCCGTPVLSEHSFLHLTCPSKSSLSRAFNLSSNELMLNLKRRHCWSVLKRVRENPEQWLFAIDTTSHIKRTKGLDGGGIWANSKNEFFTGQNMMMLAAVNKVTGESIPVNWKACLKKEDRESELTNLDLVPLILKELIEIGWPKLPVVMDSWFDSAPLLNKLNELCFEFCVELKSRRKVKKQPAPRNRKRKLSEIFARLPRETVKATTRDSVSPVTENWKNVRFFASQEVWIGGTKVVPKQFKIRVCAVFNHPKETEAFGYYATNSLSRPCNWAWKMSRYRWNIEVCFRDLKQGFAWGKFQAKSAKSAELAWILPILMLGLLREKFPNTPILQLLAKNKKTETFVALEFIANNPKSTRIENLKNRLKFSIERNNGKKPTAEKNNIAIKYKKTA